MKAIYLGLLLCIISIATADGKYFSATATDPPNMPRQRALITFRDGVETLIVESVVKGTGEDLAWIVPVPNEPSEVSFATPGTVATLPAVLAPKVVTGSSLMPEIFVPLALVLLLYALTALRRPTMTTSRFLVGGFVLLVLWFVATAILFPVFASAGAADVAGGDWRATDGWESTAISGKEPGEVVSWLRENGFSVPQDAETVIASYVQDGWWFAVARVSSKDGEGAPLPLKIVFETDKPIYPMRLTGVGLDSLYVDLCVIADGPAEADPLNTWESRQWNSQDPPTKHPRLAELAWDGAVATRMAGEMSGAVLDQDVAISLGGDLGRRTVAARGAIAVYGITWTAVAMCAALLLVGALCIAKKWKIEKLLLFGFLLPIAFGVLATITVGRFVPTVETGRSGSMAAKNDARTMAFNAEQWANDIEGEDFYKTNAARYVRDIDSKWGKDVPGGVLREEDQIIAYDEHGNPTNFEITDAEDDYATDD